MTMLFKKTSLSSKTKEGKRKVVVKKESQFSVTRKETD